MSITAELAPEQDPYSQLVPSSQPPPLVAPRGRSAGAGALKLIFQGTNFTLNWLNDRIQQRRVQAALERIRPAVDRARRTNPTHGVLLHFHWFQLRVVGPSLIVPGARFSHIEWATGLTASEARQRLAATARISPGPGRNETQKVTTLFLRSARRAPASALRTPFPEIATCSLVPGVRFQDVRWGGMLGFDDERRSRPSGSPTRARFAILRPPSTIRWINGRMPDTTKIQVVTRPSSNGRRIKVVDLDTVLWGDVTAAMLFPRNRAAMRMVHTSRRTRDDGNQLRHHVNFRLVRWARPEDIVVR